MLKKIWPIHKRTGFRTVLTVKSHFLNNPLLVRSDLKYFPNAKTVKDPITYDICK